MVRTSTERILLVADDAADVAPALSAAVPGATIHVVGTWFDAIAELSGGSYTAVVAATGPIEKRPDAAVRTVRRLAGDARLVLYGDAALEPLSRRMLEVGCDDYLISPIDAAGVHEVFGQPRLRISPSNPAPEAAPPASPATEPTGPALLANLPLAELMLDAMVAHPHDAPAAAIALLNGKIAPEAQLALAAPGDPAPPASLDGAALSHPILDIAHDPSAPGTPARPEFARLHLCVAPHHDLNAASVFLSRVAHILSRLYTLRDRHNGLQKLAITDELTGLYNARWFHHFLARMLEKARAELFGVSLLIFDIDNFKRYNDEFGHAVGDEILKETAALMKRCVREHDLVARLGGDEFAVIFWEKDGPRAPRQSDSPVARVPHTTQILERFKRLLASSDFPGLGPSGKGRLTISGGLASFPWHASSKEELIQKADHALMFGAKKSGKNSIFLVDEHS